jgi:molybdopterin molybdotransferase
VITPLQAAALIRRNTPSSVSRVAALADCCGSVLAADVRAGCAMPVADNSAMDGYVIRSVDVARASKDRPVKLRVAGTLKAGDGRTLRIAAGTAYRIMTGAFIPTGGTAVIPKEDAKLQEGRLCVEQPIRTGQHIRRCGEEIQKGQLLLKKGTCLHPAAIGVLASFGFASASVYQKPRVTVLATGNELTAPGKKLSPGKIYDSNSWMIRSALLQIGVSPLRVLTLRDEIAKVRRAIRTALAEGDCLILLGGVSVGDYDVVKEALALEKVRTVFWKVNQKPGKPLYFGRKAKKIIFGLPGNPAAAFTCFYEYIVPALFKMLGRSEPGLRQRAVKTEGAVPQDKSKHLFLKARVSKDSVKHSAADELTAQALNHQGSHMLTSLVDADGFLRVPPSGEGAPQAGTSGDRRLLMDFLPHAGLI